MIKLKMSHSNKNIRDSNRRKFSKRSFASGVDLVGTSIPAVLMGKSFHQTSLPKYIIKASFGKKEKTLGANSVFVLLPEEKGKIESVSSKAVFYKMNYQSRKPQDKKRGKKNGGSFTIDFNDLEYREHDRGGVRSYFRKATTMCPYYEMHVTNLNPGVKSHEPHTHNASEFIIMIEGETEMEIGDKVFTAKAGDIYFAPANVPHAIRNTGSAQAMYFAYQWE